MTRRKMNTIFVIAIMVLITSFSVGYSALSKNLTVSGDVSLYFNSNKLYDVIKKDAIRYSYAHEYPNAHGDSMNESLSTKKIYSYRATNDTTANEILDRFNVIFGNFCWQMYRTTDTGGVMLQYNGEIENGKCLSTRGSHVGYSNYATQTFNVSYYYGTSYTYNSSTGLFYLSGTKTTGSIQTGKYTCLSTDSNAGCSTLYLVDILNSGNSYYAFYIKNNINYAVIGKTPYNYRSRSPADVGYMYNARYIPSSFSLAPTTDLYTRVSTTLSFYYGDLQIVNGQYKLTNTFQINSTSEASSTIGKYTLGSSDPNATASTAYYIAYAYSSYIYTMVLSSGNNLSYYDTIFTYGTSYTDNGNGTYTINDPSTIPLSRWSIDGSEDLERKYVCVNATNNTCSELLHIHNYTDTYYNAYSTNRMYKIGKNFTYNNGNYTITNDETTKTIWDSEYTDYFSNNYTCFNNSGICSTLCRPFSSGGDSDSHIYMPLTGGKGIEDINDEMFTNVYNSTAKSALEYWYEKELLGTNAANKIDDIIFCSGRNGNSYSSFDGSGFKCNRIKDKFSISNNEAKLKYPIGMISRNEKEYLNSVIIRRVNENYYTITPWSFRYNYGGAQVFGVSDRGGTYDARVDDLKGLRPVIALKPGTEYTSGTGSREDPYVVSTTN